MMKMLTSSSAALRNYAGDLAPALPATRMIADLDEHIAELRSARQAAALNWQTAAATDQPTKPHRAEQDDLDEKLLVASVRRAGLESLQADQFLAALELHAAAATDESAKQAASIIAAANAEQAATDALKAAQTALDISKIRSENAWLAQNKRTAALAELQSIIGANRAHLAGSPAEMVA